MKKQSIKTGTKDPAKTDSGQPGSTPPQQWQGILKARALALAQIPEQAEATESIEVVIFMLAYETYGIETAWVREVYPLKDLTPLPCTPAFVAGIVNVRGQVISVIDIKKFFDLPEKGLTDLNKVIILSNGVMEFGILADAVVEVKTIPLNKIQSGLPTLTGIREDYLRGITAERLVILDAAKLLTDSNIIVHEECA
ncbi:MAG: chemotaxis protein CheW [Methylobacter sp.]